MSSIRLTLFGLVFAGLASAAGANTHSSIASPQNADQLALSKVSKTVPEHYKKKHRIFQNLYFDESKALKSSHSIKDALKGLKAYAQLPLQPNMKLRITRVEAGPLELEEMQQINVHPGLEAGDGRNGGDSSLGLEFHMKFN